MSLPYLDIPAIPLPFGQKIDIFGVMSTAGVFLGAWLAARAAKWYGPGDDTPLRDVVPWAVIGGLTGGHWLHIFAYHPELLSRNDPFLVLRVWDGLSSMGGVLGALLGIVLFFRKNKIPLLPYADALALGTAPGWSVARIGCYFVHDHPGIKTDFFLAVPYPDGMRHDLGIYDAIALAAIAGLLYLVARKKRGMGLLMGLLATIYPVWRFTTDFLRASDLGFVDRRYLGLTPAQYIVIGLFLIGVRLLWLSQKQPGGSQPLTAKA